jgi:hypothetical protein
VRTERGLPEITFPRLGSQTGAAFKLFANRDFAKTVPADNSDGQARATRRAGLLPGMPENRIFAARSFGLGTMEDGTGAIRNVGSTRVQLVEFELK